MPANHDWALFEPLPKELKWAIPIGVELTQTGRWNRKPACRDAGTKAALPGVRDGDRILLSVKDHRLDLLVTEAELARRRAAFAPPPAPTPAPTHGYA